MKIIILLTVYLLSFSVIQGQVYDSEVEILKADLNANGQMDEIKPSANSLELSIDENNYTIPFEYLGFEFLSHLSFKNKILNISGYNSGTGAYSWTYKFRYNKLNKKIELIGYDDFNKWVSGNISTSINTLTKRYEVNLSQYNRTKNEMETKKYTGKVSIRKIGLTDINEKDLLKLSGVGARYWD